MPKRTSSTMPTEGGEPGGLVPACGLLDSIEIRFRLANTGPVWIAPEIADDITGPWLGGTNVVTLEDSAHLFRARDALPLGAATTRHLRVR